MGHDSPKPAGPFPPKGPDDWRAKVEADLKGASVATLATERLDGIEQRALYTRDDAIEGARLGVPGLRPFIRGSQVNGGWIVRQEYDDPRIEVSHDAIVADLQSGVEALWLRLAPQWGIRVLTVDDLDRLLNGVDLARVSVCLEARVDAFQVASSFAALARRRDIPLARLAGGYGLDPLGTLAATGALEGGIAARFRELSELAYWANAHTPSMRAVLVSSRPYHDAGATDVQELAWTLATAAEYLRQLFQAGLEIDQAAKQLYFCFPVSGDFFGQIAKLRAARLLWGKAVIAAGGTEEAAAMHMHASTSRFNKSDRDPWVNMLRATAEVAGAVIAGANSVASAPFDEPVGPSDAFARRVARNTQTVLRDESHLGQVIDPAGGSWFIEQLTDALARKAWSAFQEIERAGGFAQVLRRGTVANELGAIGEHEKALIGHRRIRLVGVNEFANLAERPLDRAPVNEEQLEETLQQSLEGLEHAQHRERFVSLAEVARDHDAKPGSLVDVCIDAVDAGIDHMSLGAVLRHGRPDLHIEPCRAWHAAGPWQALRDESDHIAEERGRRPSALMANLGSLSSHIARSTGTRNLLAAAGIEAIDTESFETAEAAATRWKETEADLAVICGSDATYETMLGEAVDALKAAGCDLLYVSGRLGDKEAELQSAGVVGFLFEGADALSLMEAVHEAVRNTQDE